MNKEINQQIEEIISKRFHKPLVYFITERRNPNETYMVEIKVLGLPFTIKSTGVNLETAEEQAIETFEEKAINNCDVWELAKNIEEVELTDKQLDIIFGSEDEVPYMKPKKYTKAYVGEYSRDKYIALIESSIKNIRSIFISKNKERAVTGAALKAKLIYSPFTIAVGEFWPNIKKA